nr:retrovirus-related Pol polyprotein from transposon TNT 1-94 [Tanacetum cinerariifolium]
MFINNEKCTLVIIDEYTRIDNKIEFRNTKLESFCDERGISQNFSSPYTPEQNAVAERKNRTLTEAVRTMLNELVLFKHFWNEAVRIACYTQNRSIIVKRQDKTPYKIFGERIPDINYFHIFGCLVFIHNYKDHLRKFDKKADDGYFFGYSFNFKVFRVFNTRREQIEDTYHVTFNESIEAIGFSNTLVDETRIDDSTRYTPDEFLQEDDTSKKYYIDSDISYFHPTSQDRWSKDKHIELVNIIGDPGEGILTRSMAAKLTASTSECLFADFVSKIEPKKVTELKGMEAIRIFLAFATYTNFIVFQMDVKGFDLKGYSDSDYLGCNMDRKSTLSACQILGGKLVCWSAKKQHSVAMSSAKAEYVAAARCCANILWMKSQLSDYDIHYKMVPIFYGNTSAIAISNNLTLHSRTKHIDIRYHFIRDYILKGDIELHFIPNQALYHVLRFYSLFGGLRERLKKFSWLRFGRHEGVLGCENRPLMLNKDNYVPWSSRIIRYARSRTNGKMIVDSIENGPYVRQMIATPGEPDLPVPVPESFHEQTDEELTDNDINCETTKEIWEHVRQIMKGLDIEEQEKKAKLFNEWEKFTSTDRESIES